MITNLPLHDGEVHLYRFPLPHLPSELSRFEHYLSADETVRAGHLKNDRIKKRSIAGRGVLREILGKYLGVEPGEVRLDSGEHGKPRLADGAENIRFNLSHTGDVLLLAVSINREVGIDIETMETGKPLHDMARIAFSRREQEELLGLPSADQLTQAFYRFWVRKEACLKGCGGGFSLANDSFDVNWRTEAEHAHVICCNQSFWHVIDIHVPPPYCAALAVEARSTSQSPPKVVWVTP